MSEPISDAPEQKLPKPAAERAASSAMDDAGREEAAQTAAVQHEKPLAESVEGDPQPAAEGMRPADTEAADDVLTHRAAGTEQADAAVLAESARHTRRSFVVAAAAAAAGYGFYRYLDKGPRDEQQPRPLREAFDANAALSRAVFQGKPLAPTYPLSRAESLRVNGVYGIKRALVPGSYRLQVAGAAAASTHPRYAHDITAWEYQYAADPTHEDAGHDTKVDPNAVRMTAAAAAAFAHMDDGREDDDGKGRKPRGVEEAGESDSTLEAGTPGLLLTMDDVLRLPRHELVTQFKCIEGWSQIVHWAGVRMADFLEAYPPAPVEGKTPRYVYMETPNGDYYCGYDLDALRHPQALLVTEMMGAPLTQYHGAPLRLHMPTRYGYKQIKSIGLIAYTDDKPDDYWTKLGYDWYAGL